ncbi:TIGR02678 family protein [Streptomyces sp. YIM 98790]|uniref:TIGR02678 family protein n=1 Tax=Streptomyces sp. YIM 98790 TaxID=2689077 RepID=UPI0014074925|nr:TIGR02678 family protein [Streptomyces sp. YIM 98790]
MSNLANQLVVAERDEISRAIRLLLARPLLTRRHDPEPFELVRRRRDPLVQWFDYHVGWTLAVEPRLGYARLFKVRQTADASRPARRARAGRAPFDRRRYTLLCVAAAELLSVPVTTIGLLAERVVRATAEDKAVPLFDTASRAERMAFVDVLRLLETLGALRAVDGTTDSYTESAEAKVLYRVDTTLLMRLIAAPEAPSRLALPPAGIPVRFDELLDGLMRERRYGETGDTAPAGLISETQRNLRLRHSVLRRLFDDPVLHREDLSPDEAAYLLSPTGRQIVRRAAAQAGFVLEERAEGILLADPDGIATDSAFPDGSGTAKTAALLLLDFLLQSPGGAMPEQLAAEAERLLGRHPRWAAGYRSEGGGPRLAADAVDVLCSFGLARRTADRITTLPAAARYRVTISGPDDRPAPERAPGQGQREPDHGHRDAGEAHDEAHEEARDKEALG